MAGTSPSGDWSSGGFNNEPPCPVALYDLRFRLDDDGFVRMPAVVEQIAFSKRVLAGTPACSLALVRPSVTACRGWNPLSDAGLALCSTLLRWAKAFCSADDDSAITSEALNAAMVRYRTLR